MTPLVVLDWDGTMVENSWPTKTTKLMPGVVENMRRLHNAGIRLTVYSARYNPRDPFTGLERPVGLVQEELNYIRYTLDRNGLTFISIYKEMGKPGGDVYVDDKAERYHGTTKSWDKLTEKILMRLGKDEI